MNLSLEEYRNAVEVCAMRKNNYVFHNEGAEHARIILSNLFVNADKEIRMASNSLTNTEIVNTEEYKNALMTFLNKPDTRLRIILTHVPCEDKVTDPNGLFAMLYYHPAYKEGRVLIHDGKGKSFRGKSGNAVNFCVGDTTMYRLETDVQNWRAVANFNDESWAKSLSGKFDSVFDKLPELNLKMCFEGNGAC